MPPSPAMGPADALRMISPDLKLSLTLAVILISGLIPVGNTGPRTDC